MEVISDNTGVQGPAKGEEYGQPRQIWNHIWREVWCLRLRRWLPRLVWIGDEIDVRVKFPEDPLQPGNEFPGLFSGGLYDIQKQLLRMGISFDSGCGPDGRDWEWDYSLSGPMRVTFVGRARRPDERVRKKGPRLTLAGVGPIEASPSS